MPLSTEVGLSPDDIVLDKDTQLTPKKVAQHPRSPPFSVHVLMYCGQTAGWINMLLCIDVGLGPGHTVLDGDVPSSATPKGHSSPHVMFGPSVVSKRLDGSRCHLAGMQTSAQATLC